MQNIDIIHYILICALIPLIIVVNRTLYQRIKSEEHREKGKIVQLLIKTLSLVQFLCVPALFMFSVILKLSLEYFEFPRKKSIFRKFNSLKINFSKNVDSPKNLEYPKNTENHVTTLIIKKTNWSQLKWTVTLLFSRLMTFGPFVAAVRKTTKNPKLRNKIENLPFRRFQRSSEFSSKNHALGSVLNHV